MQGYKRICSEVTSGLKKQGQQIRPFCYVINASELVCYLLMLTFVSFHGFCNVSHMYWSYL